MHRTQVGGIAIVFFSYATYCMLNDSDNANNNDNDNVVDNLQCFEDVIVGARGEICRRSLSPETIAASNRVGRREDDGQLVHDTSARLS